jgi:hypothetical protein
MTKDFLAAIAVAAATAAATLAVLWPAPIEAVNPPPGAVQNRVQPTLKASGCELTVTASSAKYQPGEMAALELTAVNKTDQPVSLTVVLKMTSQAPNSERSRLVLPPRQVWQGECSFSLEPLQRRVLPVTTDVPLPPGSMVSVTVSVGKESMVGASFAVDGPPRPPGRMSATQPATQPVRRP